MGFIFKLEHGSVISSRAGSSHENEHIDPLPENDGFIFNYVIALPLFKIIVMEVSSWAFPIICGKINAMF